MMNWKLLSIALLGLTVVACNDKKEEKKAEAAQPEAVKVEGPKASDAHPAETAKVEGEHASEEAAKPAEAGEEKKGS